MSLLFMYIKQNKWFRFKKLYSYKCEFIMIFFCYPDPNQRLQVDLYPAQWYGSVRIRIRIWIRNSGNLNIFPDILIKNLKFFFRTKVFFLSWKTIVLDHSASFKMQIEKEKKNLQKSTNKWGLPHGGAGGSESYRSVRNFF